MEGSVHKLKATHRLNNNPDSREPNYLDSTHRWDEDIGTRIIQATVKNFPALTFSHFTYNADAVQTGFYLVGGGRGSFTNLMRKEVADLTESFADGKFKHFIASGASHCVTQTSIYRIEEEPVVVVFSDITARVLLKIPPC